MVALNFNAELIQPGRVFRVTFGKSRSEFRWSDRRALTWDELMRLLTSDSIGQKDGPCFTPATFTGFARRMDQAASIDLVALDADCGHSLDEISRAVSAKGWRAIIHSTYSHLSDRTVIAAGACDKWLSENEGATVAGYMRAKKGYLDHIIASAEIIDDFQDAGTRSYIVQHAPCPKYRIVLPLDEPWIAGDFPSQAAANAIWRERIGALAHALKLHHDQSCVDTSRLFYLPRHKPETQFLYRVLAGDDCPLWTLPDVAAEPAPSAPLLSLVRPAHLTFSGASGQIDLTAWAARHAARFEIANALRARSPGKFGTRRTGVKLHIECPNAGKHVTGGADRTGTFVVNASQLSRAGLPSITSGFVIHCMHNGCVGLDRLDHLRQMLCDGTLAVPDLTDARFLVPEAPAVDASRLLRQAPPSAAPAGNVAPALHASMTGALGAIHEHILACSFKPQPVLALGAALAFMAAAIGRRVTLQHWATRPNIYVLGVAHSGAGKERPMSVIKQMARAAGLFEELIGVEEVASDSGIVASVIRKPRQIMLIDEIGFLFAAAHARNAGNHLANVMGTLLKLYSSSHTTFQSKSYADQERVQIIDQPCVSMYGTSTPDGLMRALTSADIKNGLMSRATLFDAGDNDPRAAPPSQADVPAVIVDWLRAWNAVSPAPNPLHRSGGAQVLEPRIVPMTTEAQEIARAFEGEMHDAKIAARKSGTDALYVRALENALKFALIRACAPFPVKSDAGPVIDEAALRVDAEIMHWACALSRATITQMEASSDDISDTVFEDKRRAVRDLIRKGGDKGVTHREMARHRAGRLPKREMDDILQSLSTSGDVFFVSNVHGGQFCRPRPAYVFRDFVKGEEDE